MPKTQREQIDGLREEIAELRKQLSAISVAMAELAARAPSVITYVYSTPAPAIQPPWSPIRWWCEWPNQANVESGAQVVISASAGGI